MPEEILLTETVDPSTLTNAQRGHLAELAFMRKAVSLGFSVSKPWQEGERYDIIVRANEALWRVQVKSVLAKTRPRSHYRINLLGGRVRRRAYSAGEIDFLAAYIFPDDLWYVFPASVIEKRTVICVRPGSNSSHEKYREAWRLMRPQAPEIPAKGIAIQAVAVQERVPLPT